MKYRVEVEIDFMKNEIKCLSCPLLNEIGDCVLQIDTFGTWKEQLKNCPLMEDEDANTD